MQFKITTTVSIRILPENKETPEYDRIGIVSQYLEEECQTDDSKDHVGIGSDVWMPKLIHFEENKNCDHVHEGRVELKVDLKYAYCN